MNKKQLASGIILMFVLIVSGCSHMPAGLASSSSPLDRDGFTVLGHAEGTSSYVSVLSIFPMGTPDYNTAIKNAISKYPEGTNLINVRTYSTIRFFYLFSIYELTVEGDVIGK